MTGTVLVTGGAGFIGRHVVRALVEQGRSVRVLDDLSTGCREDLDPAADLFVGDITDPEMVGAVMAGIERVVHLAAHRAVPRSFADPHGTDLVNRIGTAIVLDAARRAGAARVVAASSSSVYGSALNVPTAEHDRLAPLSPYASSKLAAERLCQEAAAVGLDTVSLRYFNVYGPGQPVDTPYPTLIPLVADALARGVPVVVHGDGRQRRDFTFVSDAVTATLAALDAPLWLGGRALNVAGGRSWSVLDVIELLGLELDVRPEVRHVVARPGDPLHTEADLTAIGHLLGYRPVVSLPHGLAEFVTHARLAGSPVS